MLTACCIRRKATILPARLALAEAALQAATRLRPDAGETHLARATYLYYCLRDYTAHLPSWKWRGAVYPNDPRIFKLTGFICAGAANRKKDCVTWRGQWNLIRAIFLRSNRLPSATWICGAIQRWLPHWIAH